MEAGGAAGDDEQQTFWCHECDMSVSLQVPCPSPEAAETTTTATTLLCPHCFSDLLELMDSSSSSSSADSYYYYSDFLQLEPPQSQPPPYDDNYLLNSPFFHRLIHHFSTHPPVNNPATTDSDTPPSSLPASKASVDAIPTVQITSSMLDVDPFLLCAVCKDPFVPSVDAAKQLPCNHLYHPHCILPWLSSHSSCPLCRFQLPTTTDTPTNDLNPHYHWLMDSASHGTSLRLANIVAAATARHQPELMVSAATSTTPNLNLNGNNAAHDSSFNGNL